MESNLLSAESPSSNIAALLALRAVTAHARLTYLNFADCDSYY